MRHAAASLVYDYDAVRRIEEDPTGLLNEGFRYRDLETGCFITRDPIGNTLMMPKEKWMVDGREVSAQEYEEALEPGVPQAGNGPTKTAKDSGAEAEAHIFGSYEEAIPGQKSHWHTAAAGFPNLYTYVNDNPWTFFDPEGLDYTQRGPNLTVDTDTATPVHGTGDRSHQNILAPGSAGNSVPGVVAPPGHGIKVGDPATLNTNGKSVPCIVTDTTDNKHRVNHEHRPECNQNAAEAAGLHLVPGPQGPMPSDGRKGNPNIPATVNFPTGHPLPPPKPVVKKKSDSN